MTKKFFRSLAICIAVFAFSLLTMYLTYFFTINYNDKSTQNPITKEATVEAKPVDDSVVDEQDHYMARLEGSTIKVYMCREGGELFLYNLNTYINDLPKQDKENLKRGIILKNKSELTAFEEDYNS